MARSNRPEWSSQGSNDTEIERCDRCEVAELAFEDNPITITERATADPARVNSLYLSTPSPSISPQRLGRWSETLLAKVTDLPVG